MLSVGSYLYKLFYFTYQVIKFLRQEAVLYGLYLPKQVITLIIT